MPNLLKVYDSRYSPDWATIPDELLEALAPTGTTYLTTRQRAALNRLAAGRHFLVKNLWGARCDGCNRIHPYMTIRCVEAPFNGLRQVYEWIDSQADAERIYRGLRELSVRNPDMDGIVAISASDAGRYNQRIRDRGGVPVIDQRPLRRDELDEEAMNRRIVARARKFRAAGQTIGL